MQSKFTAALMMVCVGAAFAACDVPEEETAMPGEERPGYETETPPLPAAPEVVSAEFEAPEGVESAVTGDVTVTEQEPDGFRVEADLQGLGEGPHAWHIHSGACGTEAPIVIAFTETADMPGLGDPLENDDSGEAEGSVTVPENVFSFSELRQGDFSVHVHETSGVEPGPTVACADL